MNSERAANLALAAQAREPDPMAQPVTQRLPEAPVQVQWKQPQPELKTAA